ncbi:hypothetical protein E4U54_008255 [Claviceps lovelessii]|nr:hypothetical protein E4U54_008255 [Claviceps lovelessii]
MAWELEGLILHLLMLISCAGEKGCPVKEIVNEIKGSSGISGMRSRNAGEPLSDHAVSTIWNWLVARSDVSVGHGGEYNEVPLVKLLQLSDALAHELKTSGEVTVTSSSHTSSGSASDNPASISSPVINVFVSEDTMWELITGHTVNYMRVPGLEWLLLLGIASTKSQGILQGDLGRLVAQDKRSVPKRTDALLKKGYIVKRTTLVRGTKTSKLWLKSFAPPLTKEGENQTLECEEEMNITSQSLTANLDQVPWHTRWTGDSMDFHALATTIMAVTKEWQVIRLQDLKAKLGVLGLRWQMKIVSKICRFLNSCGAIQYVAAKLDNKVYKDCIKFNQDLSAKDWAAFLATGKRSTKPVRAALSGVAERADPEWQADISQVNGARLGECPPWTVDEPLPQKITRCAQSFGPVGVTNPEIYVLTLGPTFNRYISSLTSCMATSNVQPPELMHFQLKSEHIRVGKVASYRFCTPQVSQTAILAGMHESPEMSRNSTYGFSSGSWKPGLSGTDVTLSTICGLVKTRSMGRNEEKPRGRPRKKLPEKSPSKSTEPEAPLPKPQSVRRADELLITLRVSTGALQSIVSSHTPVKNATSPSPKQHSEKVANIQVPRSNLTIDPYDNSDHDDRSGSVRRGSRARARARGRPTQAKFNADVSPVRPWTCEKCGRSWKNDIGLKYHLEKSHTPCNPQYGSLMQPTSAQDKCSTSSNHRIEESVDPGSAIGSTETKRPIVPPDSLELAVVSPEPNLSGHRAEQIPIDDALSTNQDPTARKADTSIASSPANGTVKSWRRRITVSDEAVKFSLPKVDQGLLLPRATETRSQGLILHNHTRPDAGTIGNNVSSKNVGCIINLAKSTTATSKTSVYPEETLEGQDGTTPVDVTDVTADQAESVGGQIDGSKRKAESVLMPKRGLKPSKAKTKNSHPELRLLIQRLLKEQHGAVIGGKPLWDSVLALWNREFIEKAAPGKTQFQSTLDALLKDGIVVEHWHAFREFSGSFSKCQLLTLPGVDAFSPQSLKLLEKVKRPPPTAHGEIVLNSDTNDGLSEVKVGGRGRRALAKEVATLRAPVYVAQVAAKKDQESENRDRVKRQRHWGTSDGTEHVASTPSFKRQKVCQAASLGSPPDFLESQDEFSRYLHGTAPALRLQFLEPNEFLGQDAPDMEFLQNMSSDTTHRAVQPSPKDGISTNLSNSFGNGAGSETRHSSVTVLRGSQGSWLAMDSQYFEQTDGSFTTRGWMPDTQWLGWESFALDLEKQFGCIEPAPGFADIPDIDRHRRFVDALRTCFEMEMRFPVISVKSRPRPAGPHNIFVRFGGSIVNMEAESCKLIWPANGQLNWSSGEFNSAETEDTSSSDDSELDWEASTSAAKTRSHTYPVGRAETASHVKAKRVALVTRALTSLPGVRVETSVNDDVDREDYPFDSPNELIAAFIAVRTLMGGTDKSVDWGLLMFIFPNASLQRLRKFWDVCRKQQGPYISTLTRAFQGRYLAAIEREDVPMIDFDKPQEYDWAGLIRWTVDIPRQEGFEIPRSRTLFDGRFSLTDSKAAADDWRERFFHVQASVFARFEAVTSLPAAFPLVDPHDVETEKSQSSRRNDLDIARSWVKSLCVTEDGKYSVENIRDKFLTLLPGNKRMVSIVFKEAIDQLTKQRIICKSKKPPLGGRPYRLNEGYLAILGKLAQNAKYDDAARFKIKLDVAFRKHGKLAIPYSFSDGAIMALTNLSAAGRIQLVPTNLPYIPFGFEPGNYESRKYPKSYYHFGLEAVPTEIYLFNEQIDVVRTACATPPPLAGRRGELPQWVDIFGQLNQGRWSEVLGAFCFAIATRGSMDIRGICSTLQPILDEFEVRLIMLWGERTGVLTDFSDGIGSLVGEWWWLVVPWLRMRHIRKT